MKNRYLPNLICNFYCFDKLQCVGTFILSNFIRGRVSIHCFHQITVSTILDEQADNKYFFHRIKSLTDVTPGPINLILCKKNKTPFCVLDELRTQCIKSVLPNRPPSRLREVSGWTPEYRRRPRPCHHRMLHSYPFYHFKMRILRFKAPTLTNCPSMIQ